MKKKKFHVDQVGEEFVDKLYHGADISSLLEYLVQIGLLSRDGFPISSKITEVKHLVLSQKWEEAEQLVLVALKESKKSEKMICYGLLEEIYENLDPQKLEKLWIFLAKEHEKLSQFSEAERFLKKANNKFNCFESACLLARIFYLQKNVKQSVRTYYSAAISSLCSDQIQNVLHCVEEIQKIDPQMEYLSHENKISLLTLFQLAKLSKDYYAKQHAFMQLLSMSQENNGNALVTILKNAIASNHDQDIDILSMIMEHWEVIPINTVNRGTGETFLSMAIRTKKIETVKALLTHPCINVDITNKSSGNCLSIASQIGFTECVTLLCDYSSTLDEKLTLLREKPIGLVEYLYIALLGDLPKLIVGIDLDGNKEILDVSSGSIQEIMKQLEQRGMKAKNSNVTSSFKVFAPTEVELEPIKNAIEEVKEKLDRFKIFRMSARTTYQALCIFGKDCFLNNQPFYS